MDFEILKNNPILLIDATFKDQNNNKCKIINYFESVYFIIDNGNKIEFSVFFDSWCDALYTSLNLVGDSYLLYKLYKKGSPYIKYKCNPQLFVGCSFMNSAGNSVKIHSYNSYKNDYSVSSFYTDYDIKLNDLITRLDSGFYSKFFTKFSKELAPIACNTTPIEGIIETTTFDNIFIKTKRKKVKKQTIKLEHIKLY